MNDHDPAVVALVLTFDAPENAEACLRAITAQTTPVREVLVIENPGDRQVEIDQLRAFAPVVRVTRLTENVGPAGGYAAGLLELAASDCDLLWVMDDDVHPEPHCLEMLLKHRPLIAGVIPVPRAVDSTTGEDASTWGWIGALLPRSLVLDIGGPRPELFYGFEDQDYLIDRAQQAGFTLVREPSATVELVRRRGQQGGRPAWHSYYLPRNATYQHLYRRRHVPFVQRVKRLLHFLWSWIRDELRQPDGRRRKWLYFVRGIADGVSRRLGRRVVPDVSGRPRIAAGNSGSDAR